MYEELNYFWEKNQKLEFIPNQYDMVESYNHFTSNNFSKISLLFYGTYKESTICEKNHQILLYFKIISIYFLINNFNYILL